MCTYLIATFWMLSCPGCWSSEKLLLLSKHSKSQDFHLRDEIRLYLYGKSVLYGTTFKLSTAHGSIFTRESRT